MCILLSENLTGETCHWSHCLSRTYLSCTFLSLLWRNMSQMALSGDNITIIQAFRVFQTNKSEQLSVRSEALVWRLLCLTQSHAIPCHYQKAITLLFLPSCVLHCGQWRRVFFQSKVNRIIDSECPLVLPIWSLPNNPNFQILEMLKHGWCWYSTFIREQHNMAKHSSQFYKRI